VLFHFAVYSSKIFLGSTSEKDKSPLPSIRMNLNRIFFRSHYNIFYSRMEYLYIQFFFPRMRFARILLSRVSKSQKKNHPSLIVGEMPETKWGGQKKFAPLDGGRVLAQMWCERRSLPI
jgi:hypothetical protein